MQIMSLNGWGGKLHDELMPYLETTQPDILCLQEVVHTPTATKDWLTYRDGEHILPQRARFLSEVSSALPNHLALFCPAAQGDLWDGEERVDSQWGIATFVRKIIPLIGQKQGFVHLEYSPYGYGEHPRSRSVHAIRVFDYKNGSPITIVHMHGLRDVAGKQDTPERLIQANRLVEIVDSVARAGDRIVVCGDFNVLPGSETFSILGKAGLTDLVTDRGFISTRTAHYKKEGRFADYMLVNAHLAHATFDVIYYPEVSDHCPLVLEI